MGCRSPYLRGYNNSSISQSDFSYFVVEAPIWGGITTIIGGLGLVSKVQVVEAPIWGGITTILCQTKQNSKHVVEAPNLKGYNNKPKRPYTAEYVVEAPNLKGYNNYYFFSFLSSSVVEAPNLKGYNNRFSSVPKQYQVVEAPNLKGYNNSFNLLTLEAEGVVEAPIWRGMPTYECIDS